MVIAFDLSCACAEPRMKLSGISKEINASDVDRYEFAVELLSQIRRLDEQLKVSPHAQRRSRVRSVHVHHVHCRMRVITRRAPRLDR
jgi:hypothetical protein